jgi:hypothetical protein
MTNTKTDPFIQIYQKDPNVVAREIAGEMILVPIRKNVGDMESIYVLNDTAMFAWQLFDGNLTLAEIHARMIEAFDVDQNLAGQDMLELVSNLERVGALIKTNG